jgi:DNA invertase Pin-like site-specific DNA recombinase
LDHLGLAERSSTACVEDAGISGAKGRYKPGLEAMMKAVNAKEFDLVAAWSLDRLGRSLTDLLGILQELQEKGVDLFLHQRVSILQPPPAAMFQMLGVFSALPASLGAAH